VEALVPGLVAAVIGYTIVGVATGFQPIFNPPPQTTQFDHPLSLILFALLGVGCALLARFMFGVFFRIEKFFKRFPLWMATAIGGFCAGVIGLAIPSVIGTATAGRNLPFPRTWRCCRRCCCLPRRWQRS